MVSPINYMMNVRSPFEQSMRGFQFGQGARLREAQEARTAEEFPLILQQRQQTMDIQRAQEARAAAAFEQQRRAAAAAQQRARAMQSQLVQLREMAAEGTLSPDALNAFAMANASTFDEFRQAYDAMSEPRRRADAQYGIQLATSLLGGNQDVALRMVDERIAAAENAGDAQEVAALRANRALIEMDPQAQGVATLAVLASSGAIDNDMMDAILSASGQGAGATTAFQTQDQQLRAAGIVPRAEGGDGRYEAAMASAGGITGGPTFRQATAEEAAQFGAPAGQIDTETGRFYPIQPPTGMTVRTTPEGGVELVQGAGVGAGTGGRTRDYVYDTDDQGLPVARPIAGTPAAAAVQEERGRLEAAVGIGENMLQTIESVVGRPAGEGQTAIRPDPALAGILGLVQGRLPPRTQAQADLLARVEQISGRAFLEAFETLKGGGQITEIEGQRATQAIARLQRTQSPEAFQEALFEFADIVRRGIERSRNELRILPEVAPAPEGAPAAPGGRIRFDAEGNRIE